LEPGEIVGFDKDALILSSVQAIDFVYFLLWKGLQRQQYFKSDPFVLTTVRFEDFAKRTSADVRDLCVVVDDEVCNFRITVDSGEDLI
jgi:hypothetical protein